MPPKTNKKVLDFDYYAYHGIAYDPNAFKKTPVKKSHAPSKKKRRRGRHRRAGNTVIPYLIIPKWKRLARKAVFKLLKEVNIYKIARAVDTADKLEVLAKEDLDKIKPFDPFEADWKDVEEKKEDGPYSKGNAREDKLKRLKIREEKRRLRLEQVEKYELRRKRYRIHPQDTHYTYKKGYEKVRHRLTKKRFMRCVDVTMLKEVISKNTALKDSPLWDDDLNVRTLNVEEAKLLRNHLQQFDVIVEALKQGLFDLPESDYIDLQKVRRKRNEDGTVADDPTKENIRLLSKYKHTYKSKWKTTGTEKLVKKKSFPPEQELPRKSDASEEPNQKAWFGKVKAWLDKGEFKNKLSTGEAPEIQELYKARIIKNLDAAAAFPSFSSDTVRFVEKKKDTTTKKRRKTSLHMGVDYPANLLSRLTWVHVNPFAQWLTLKIPRHLEKRKNLIRTLVEAKVNKKTAKKHHGNEAEEVYHDQLMRKARLERHDPLQRLHPDERDSDVWTNSDTTTTDDYASWRRCPDLVRKKDDNDIKDLLQDKTFHWRIVLAMICLWEIIVFAKGVIDDVYYSILTFHLFRENIWVSEVRNYIASPNETYIFNIVAEWVHVIIATISLSIIQKKNECVSLLFAGSLLIHGLFEIGAVSHDRLYLKNGLNWETQLKLVIKAFIKSSKICLFIAYHYHTAEYIRKAREFRHRKVKLHNHEINAKGTKGLMKRRLGWNWMTKHARKQTLKSLKSKYPNVKDGNYPMEGLSEKVKFVEAKELRLYAQQHNLNLGYPYNSLKDMKRYIFGEMEKSDYTENDDEEGLHRIRRRSTFLTRQGSSGAFTETRYRRWKEEDAKKQRRGSNPPSIMDSVQVGKLRSTSQQHLHFA